MKKRSSKRNDNGFDDWGGYMAAKKSKLEEQFDHDAASTSSRRGGIFQDIAIFVNGYTVPCAEELKALMLLHGGIYHHYESPRTTHIIASNLPHTKLKKLKPGDKVIKPEWIVDSIACGKLLDYKKYLLYTSLVNTETPISKLFQKQSNVQIDPSSDISNGCDNPITTEYKVTTVKETDSLGQTLSSDGDECSTSSSSLLSQMCKLNKHVEEKRNVDLINSPVSSVPTPPFCDNSNESDGSVCQDIRSDADVSSFGSTDVLNHSKAFVNVSANKTTSSKTASNSQFLGEFYNNSRLHHLSTMGAMFKQYVNDLREKHKGYFSGLEELHEWKQNLVPDEDVLDEFEEPQRTAEPTIMHIDMDCFFVSVGMRDHPELKDEPVAVAHGKGNKAVQREGVDRQAEFDIYRQRTMDRMGLSSENHTRFNKVSSIGEFDSMSEIASCNYKAREFGLKNGMFVGQALKQCPGLKIVHYDFEGYKEVSHCLYNVIANLTLDIEAVSCDEMYVDCTRLLQEVGLTPLQFASFIRQKIEKETKCTCSTGFGSNKLQARLATKKAKPNGQFQLTNDIVPSFIHSIPLSDLPGVGHSILHKLKCLGAGTCGDLQKIPLKTLQHELGNKQGMTLYKHCRGEDDRDLTFEHQRKSVSAEVNYGIRFQNEKEMEVFLQQLVEEVEKRLDEVKMKGKCITLKLMVRSAEAPREASKFLGHGVCDYITKSSSLAIYISQSSHIYKEVMNILSKVQVDPKELRGIGIQVSKLELQSKTIPTIDTFFKNSDVPGSSRVESESYESHTKPQILDKIVENHSPRKLIFVPDSELLSKSPKRRAAKSPKKKSPKKMGQIEKYLLKSDASSQDVPEDFDKSVFESLPEDIKKEVLRSTKQQLSILKPKEEPENTSVPDNIDESVLNALPEDIREEIIRDLSRYQSNQPQEPPAAERPLSPQLSDPASPSPLDSTQAQLQNSNMSMVEIRVMLREWLKESEPQAYDVDLFSGFLTNLVQERKLESVVVLLRFLRRHIQNKHCKDWQEAFNHMEENVQAMMKEVYRGILNF